MERNHILPLSQNLIKLGWWSNCFFVTITGLSSISHYLYNFHMTLQFPLITLSSPHDSVLLYVNVKQPTTWLPVQKYHLEVAVNCEVEDLIPRYTCNGSTASPGSPQVMLVAPPLVPTLVQLAPNQSRFYCSAHQYFWSAQYHCSSSQILLTAAHIFCSPVFLLCSPVFLFCSWLLQLTTSAAHIFFSTVFLLTTIAACFFWA